MGDGVCVKRIPDYRIEGVYGRIGEGRLKGVGDWGGKGKGEEGNRG